MLIKCRLFVRRIHVLAALALCVTSRREDAEVKTDGVPLCDFVPLCVSTVKKAKLDGPQGKTWEADHMGETCCYVTDTGQSEDT